MAKSRAMPAMLDSVRGMSELLCWCVYTARCPCPAHSSGRTAGLGRFGHRLHRRFPWTGTDGVVVGACCHGDTPGNTDKVSEQAPQRLNNKAEGTRPLSSSGGCIKVRCRRLWVNDAARPVPGAGCPVGGLEGRPADNPRSEPVLTASAWTTVAGSSPSAYHPSRP